MRNTRNSIRARSSIYAFNDEIEDDRYAVSEALPGMPDTSDGMNLQEGRQEAIWQHFMDDEAIHTGPLSFVESARFQTVVGFVIFANALIIGFETDNKSPLWWWLEQGLLVFFVFELSVRIAHSGLRFIAPQVRFGNIVDFVIVMSGVADMWFLPVYEAVTTLVSGSLEKHHHNGLTEAMGILRMLRIIRLVRLVKVIEPLYRLATGVFEAMQGMFWVLLFLVMMLYAVAIVCTRLIGHGVALGLSTGDGEVTDHGASEDMVEMRAMFHSVLSSMFMLFELMSCWSLMQFTALFHVVPMLRLFFCALLHIRCLGFTSSDDRCGERQDDRGSGTVQCRGAGEGTTIERSST